MRTLLALLVVSAITSSVRGEEKAVKPLVSLHGSKSHITTAGYHRVESADAWHRLWARHATMKGQTTSSDQAEVDFGRCMVLAVFDGKRANCCGFEVHSIVETGEQITVRIQANGYATAEGVEPHATTAWGVFVLPKSAKPVRVELDTGSRKEGRLEWTKGADLKAGNTSVEK